MTAGRKPKPTVVKLLHGVPGHRALPENEPQGQGILWAPPVWFDTEQRNQWHYSLEKSPLGLLTETDREMLMLWVCACVEYARANIEVRKHGQVIKTREGNVIQNPYLGVMNRQALIMMRVASELGFSPAARASLGNRAPEFPAYGTNTTPARSRLTAYLDAKPDRLPN